MSRPESRPDPAEGRWLARTARLEDLERDVEIAHRVGQLSPRFGILASRAICESGLWLVLESVLGEQLAKEGYQREDATLNKMRQKARVIMEYREIDPDVEYVQHWGNRAAHYDFPSHVFRGALTTVHDVLARVMGWVGGEVAARAAPPPAPWSPLAAASIPTDSPFQPLGALRPWLGEAAFEKFHAAWRLGDSAHRLRMLNNLQSELASSLSGEERRSFLREARAAAAHAGD